MEEYELAKQLNSRLRALLKSEGDARPVKGSNGDDSFDMADYARVFAGGGDDLVETYSHAFVDGGSGDDTISTYDHSRVNGGSGDDTISTYDHSRVNGGSGDDTISTYSYSHVDGGSGNDEIRTGSHSRVSGGDGDDTIRAGGRSHVNAGSGNDIIRLSGSDSTVTFSKGDGSDTIYSSGPVTIDISGYNADDVSISQEGNKFTVTFNGSDDALSLELGSDAAVNFKFDDSSKTLHAGSKSRDATEFLKDLERLRALGYADPRGPSNSMHEKALHLFARETGGHLNVDTGSGDDNVQIVLRDRIDRQTKTITAFSSFSVNTGSGDDTVHILPRTFRFLSDYKGQDGEPSKAEPTGSSPVGASLPPERSVFGGSGDDKINVWAANAYIDGGSGDDNLFAGINSHLEGGSGDDVIGVTSGSLARAGSGDDIIFASTGSTVSGDTGDDRITVGPDATVQFNAGDGFDILQMGIATPFPAPPSGSATIEFGAGLKAEDTEISVKDGVATITFKGRDDKLELHFNSVATADLKYSDGDTLTINHDDARAA